MLLERRLELLLRLVGELVLVHDARDELDLAEADREVREAGAQQALDGERDDLGISKGRRAAHELDAGLMELTLAASLRLLIAEGTADVGELQRLRIVAQAAGCEARNRRRHLVAQRERAVVLVEELEEMRLQCAARAERQVVEVLDGRRDDLVVAPLRKQGSELRLDGALLRSLHRQEVAHAVRDLQCQSFFIHGSVSFYLDCILFLL